MTSNTETATIYGNGSLSLRESLASTVVVLLGRAGELRRADCGGSPSGNCLTSARGATFRSGRATNNGDRSLSLRESLASTVVVLLGRAGELRRADCGGSPCGNRWR
ncbi:hypothetical protein [Paenibacillus sp. GCM10012306]|uniref:hypothetical protein n=1 Tax=Paenibacillus sp. GCM10012306 TaxID=3317342 RepID=UPI00361D4100